MLHFLITIDCMRELKWIECGKTNNKSDRVHILSDWKLYLLLKNFNFRFSAKD